MIDCPNGELRDVLPEYLHERLEPRARAAVAAHLAACELCTAELALLKAARAAVSATPAVDVARIVRALPKPAQRPVAVRSLPARSRTVPRWPAVFAAAVAAAALLAAGLFDRGDSRGTATSPVAAATDTGISAATSVLTDTTPQSIAGPGAAGRAPLPELTFAGGVSDLTAGDLEELIAEIDAIEALPALEPQPVLVTLPAPVSGDD